MYARETATYSDALISYPLDMFLEIRVRILRRPIAKKVGLGPGEYEVVGTPLLICRQQRYEVLMCVSAEPFENLYFPLKEKPIFSAELLDSEPLVVDLTERLVPMTF